MSATLRHPCGALGLLTLVMVAAAPGRANPIAQIICAASDQMRTRLETQLQAQRVWSGMRNPEEVMELWEEPSGDWSLTILYAEGRRCVVAMGSGLTPVLHGPQG